MMAPNADDIAAEATPRGKRDAARPMRRRAADIEIGLSSRKAMIFPARFRQAENSPKCKIVL